MIEWDRLSMRRGDRRDWGRQGSTTVEEHWMGIVIAAMGTVDWIMDATVVHV